MHSRLYDLCRCSEELQALLEAMDGVAYLVDPDGVICAAGGSALAAASERAPAEESPLSHAVGRNLMDFIAGAEVRSAYRQAHGYVLVGVRPYVTFE